MYYWLNMISLFCLTMGICLAIKGSGPVAVEAVTLCVGAFFNLISAGFMTMKLENLENRIVSLEEEIKKRG